MFYHNCFNNLIEGSLVILHITIKFNFFINLILKLLKVKF